MRFKRVPVLVWMLTFSIQATAAFETDFYAGLDAFKRGEYTVAHRVWLAVTASGSQLGLALKSRAQASAPWKAVIPEVSTSPST